MTGHIPLGETTNTESPHNSSLGRRFESYTTHQRNLDQALTAAKIFNRAMVTTRKMTALIATKTLVTNKLPSSIKRVPINPVIAPRIVAFRRVRNLL